MKKQKWIRIGKTLIDSSCIRKIVIAGHYKISIYYHGCVGVSDDFEFTTKELAAAAITALTGYKGWTDVEI